MTDNSALRSASTSPVGIVVTLPTFVSPHAEEAITGTPAATACNNFLGLLSTIDGKATAAALSQSLPLQCRMLNPFQKFSSSRIGPHRINSTSRVFNAALNW